MEQILFYLCVGVLYVIANTFGISYEAASVYINLYFEPFLCITSCLLLLLPFLRRWRRNGLDVFCGTGIPSILGYTYLVAQAWLSFLTPYIGKGINEQFYLCVEQMQNISNQWGMTYPQVNLIYFVYPEAILLVFNIYLFIKLNRLAKKDFVTKHFFKGDSHRK